MHLKSILALSVALLVPMILIGGEPGKIREIDTKDVKVDFEKGKVAKPNLIANADQLDKAIPDAAAIKKQVDFGKEKLVLFAWGGSGGDKLTPSLSADGKVATFTYKGGLTRDFRRHVHLFAIPKAAEVKLVGVPK